MKDTYGKVVQISPKEQFLEITPPHTCGSYRTVLESTDKQTPMCKQKISNTTTNRLGNNYNDLKECEEGANRLEKNVNV